MFILIPILKNPAVEALINNFIITENTLNNLQIISQILDKLVSGVFYSSDKEDESGSVMDGNFCSTKLDIILQKTLKEYGNK